MRVKEVKNVPPESSPCVCKDYYYALLAILLCRDKALYTHGLPECGSEYKVEEGGEGVFMCVCAYIHVVSNHAAMPIQFYIP